MKFSKPTSQNIVRVIIHALSRYEGFTMSDREQVYAAARLRGLDDPCEFTRTAIESWARSVCNSSWWKSQLCRIWIKGVVINVDGAHQIVMRAAEVALDKVVNFPPRLHRVTKAVWFNNDLLAFAQRQAANENCTLDSYIESLLFRHARESAAAAFGEADSSKVLPFQLPSRM